MDCKNQLSYKNTKYNLIFEGSKNKDITNVLQR